jgi:hypothetical protein
MLVGVLTGSSLAAYHNLTRLAPAPFIVPPFVWLTKPEENVPRHVINQLLDEMTHHKVFLKPVMFRHLYNPNSSLSGFTAAMTPETDSISLLRKKLCVLEAEDSFLPTMMLCHDGMRSLAMKQFCRSTSDALSNKLMEFEVFYADENDPEHKPMFENYNPESQEVFGHAISYT